uniref:Uncharacterized protein n=1 Tax=Candidatus Kentrum sp. UNK TaxID=2126344 RepID=A0A451ALL2_9GAMM|nr:MAG: hypothetical protein BECKUNK1418G_GA0071005_11162 [Candidatus Kentron sp. UNK]VFK72364.1 MAG: hypothetical protein BECKUNK1418H_GA0071006_111012 [Candidatus Kentron sp. UNK]
MVDARSDPPYGPESGLLFHSNPPLLHRQRAEEDLDFFPLLIQTNIIQHHRVGVDMGRPFRTASRIAISIATSMPQSLR